MVICPACSGVWGGRLLTCPRGCGQVRSFGDDPADARHPIARRFPIRAVLSRTVTGAATVPAAPVAGPEAGEGPPAALPGLGRTRKKET